MKKFHFRLQKLLDLRTFREKEAETALGRAIAARDAITLRLMEIARQELNTRRSLESCARTAHEFALHAHYLERLHHDRERQQHALVEAELVIDKMRALYIQAHQSRLIVTKLREKKAEHWKTESYKQQDAVLDDMVNAQQFRKNNPQTAY